MNKNSGLSGLHRMARLNWRGIALALTSTALGAMFLGGAAHAITDTVFKYTTPKTANLSLPAAAFHPTNLTNNFVNNGDTITPSTNNLTCFLAPVHLPQGAKMTVWVMWRKSGAGQFSAGLQNVPFATNGAGLIRNVPSLPDTGGVYKPANFPVSWVVNNNTESYLVFACMKSSSAGFAGMRITYTYSTAGD